MTLEELIELAKTQNPFFKRAIEYRIHGRKSPKPPDLDWLMPQLENILGKDYVRAAAHAFIDQKMKEVDENLSVVEPQRTQASSEKSEQTQPGAD